MTSISSNAHPNIEIYYRDFYIRSWRPKDRQRVIEVVASVLTEYGLNWEPELADRDVCEIEAYYWQNFGEFWVVESGQDLVGTAAYYPITRGNQAVEIRKMYLLPNARGQGLGRHLLTRLEQTIHQQGYREIWIETASVLEAAVALYESSGYEPALGVDTPRCDRVYLKRLAQC
jgi:putative acetyltransferase